MSPTSVGFLWNAQVDAAPLVHLRVIDSLIDGTATGQVLLLSAVQVGHDSGTPELNSGALHRFLAEAVWHPWALLPSEHLRWQPLSEDRANATLTVGDTSVTLEFRFAPSGEVVGIFTPGRWGSFGGAYEKRAWERHFSSHERQDAVKVPTLGEVGWYREGSLELVWKGVIDGASFAWDA